MVGRPTVCIGAKMNRILSGNCTFCGRYSRVPWQGYVMYKNDHTSVLATTFTWVNLLVTRNFHCSVLFGEGAENTV